MTPSEVTTARIAKGYTSAAAAGKAYGVSARTWQRWEDGTRTIKKPAINWLKGRG